MVDRKSAYTKPCWSGLPKRTFSIDVLRQGAVIEQHKIGEKETCRIGSDQEKNDIVYKNPQVSAQHAVIQFKESEDDGYIYDMSTHGTWKNDIKLPSKEFVPFTIGDKFAFGHKDARRIYVVHEYSEFDRGGVFTESSSCSSTNKKSTENKADSSSRDEIQDTEKKYTPKIFDQKGKLTCDAVKMIYENQDTFANQCIHKDRFYRYYDAETGTLNVKNLKNNQAYTELSTEQKALLTKIENVQSKKKFKKPKTSIAADKAASAATDNEENLNDLIESFFQTFDDDSEYVLSEQTKQELNTRLFDEEDIYYDRTNISANGHNNEFHVLEKQMAELDDQINQEIKSLNMEKASDEPAGGDDSDTLDIYMKLNQKNIKSTHIERLRQQRTTLQQALDKLKNDNNAPLESKTDVRNKAMNAASEIFRQISLNHENIVKNAQILLQSKNLDEDSSNEE